MRLKTAGSSVSASTVIATQCDAASIESSMLTSIESVVAECYA
jgi:hypothetical protein